jgi:mannose-6-phosphate isomerase-like protein (cupin superfamily)
MSYEAVNLTEKFGEFHDLWRPRVVAEINDYQVKLVRVRGDFVWHDHKDTDEAFLVIAGQLRIDFRDGSVTIGAGELYVVPKGVEHKPHAENEAWVAVIEPRGIVNTGDAGGEMTAPGDVWI